MIRAHIIAAIAGALAGIAFTWSPFIFRDELRTFLLAYANCTGVAL